MKRIIFLRTAPYHYLLEGKRLYESLDVIGMQRAEPVILEPSKVISEKIEKLLGCYQPGALLCSTSARSHQTAKLFAVPLGLEVKTTKDLCEIQFSMEDFSIAEQFPDNHLDIATINEVRYSFSESLCRDALAEKQHSIIARITSFREYADGLRASTIICFSHGFVMKLFENAFRLQYRLDDFTSLVRLYNWHKAPFGFLDGFVVEYKDEFFVHALCATAVSAEKEFI